jgi:Protein of unknown function (DUF3618)
VSMETDRIENELRESRHRLSDTLGALGDKLSPGQIVDEVLTLAQGQAGNFAANLGRQVRDNPLPAVLIALGAALLFAKKGDHSSSETGDSHRHYHLIEHAQSTIFRQDGETEGAFNDRLHAAYAKALDVKQAAGEAVDDFKRRVSNLVHGAKETATKTSDKVSHAISGAAHLAQAQGRHLSEGAARARHSAQDFYQHTPLAAGAMAIAVGALIGSATPLSNVERDKLGKVADKTARATVDLAAKGTRMVQEATAPPVH